MLNSYSPHILNNNNIIGEINFSSVILPYTSLTGRTITIGSKIYTLGTNWNPTFSNPSAVVDSLELATSLTRAINGNQKYSLPTASVNDSKANNSVEAYCAGTVVYITSRGATSVSISTNIPGFTITQPADVTKTAPNRFFSLLLLPNLTPTNYPIDVTGVKSFEVENLAAATDTGVKVVKIVRTDFSSDPNQVFYLDAGMGTNLQGSPSDYRFTNLDPGTSPTADFFVQFKLYY